MNLPFLNRWTKKKPQQVQQIEERPVVQIILSTSPSIGDTCLSYETELYEGSILKTSTTSTTSTDDSSISSSYIVDAASNQNLVHSTSLSLQSCEASQLPADYVLQRHDSLQSNNQSAMSAASRDSSVESNASQFTLDYALQSHDSLQTVDTSKNSLTTNFSDVSSSSSSTVDSVFFHVSLTKNGCHLRWCH
jgi:hypothetical protein